jgi:hypothetical protein
VNIVSEVSTVIFQIMILWFLTTWSLKSDTIVSEEHIASTMRVGVCKERNLIVLYSQFVLKRMWIRNEMISFLYQVKQEHLYGLVVRISGYRSTCSEK